MHNNCIRCITFDLDDTLWDCMPVIIRAEEALHDWFAEHFPRITDAHSVNDLRQHRASMSERRPELLHDVMALRHESLMELAGEFGYDEGMADAALDYFMSHRNRVILFEDAISTLEHLKASYRIGVITNGNAQLDVIGIDHLFDFVVYAREAGVAKPEPGIFEMALEHAEAQASEVLHVGDDPHTDMLGAAQVGMRTAWFNPAQKVWPAATSLSHEKYQPDAEISTLRELSAVLTEFQ